MLADNLTALEHLAEYKLLNSHCHFCGLFANGYFVAPLGLEPRLQNQNLLCYHYTMGHEKNNLQRYKKNQCKFNFFLYFCKFY